MAIKWANNASSTLASSISNSATSITVASSGGSLFPTLSGSDYFYATLVDSANTIEIVKVTARSGDVMTVVRAQEGTSASAYIGGDKFELRPTAAGLSAAAAGANLSGNYDITVTDGAKVNVANEFTEPQSVSVNSTGNALRITQVGSGNALLVEDSANPDSTPFVITASGTVVAGDDVALSVAGATKLMQTHAIDNTSGFAAARWDASATGPVIALGKSRGGAAGTFGIVSDNDVLGDLIFAGDDGTDLVTPGARIRAEVDGTPGANDMPTRLTFSTTADGASAVTERMTIMSDGKIGIGTAAPTVPLDVVGDAKIDGDIDFTGTLLNNGVAYGGTVETVGFTASGTYTKPAGLKAALVELVSAGGGGSTRYVSGKTTNSGQGGGGGGYSRRLIPASLIGATETVTIGAGGTATKTGTANTGIAGGAGGTTSFGSLVTATGGAGASGGTLPAAGAGGTGTTTFTDTEGFNQTGESGSFVSGGGEGGPSALAMSRTGKGAKGTGAGSATSSIYGGGGGGGFTSGTNNAATGSAGIVLVTNYF
tara:strand:+ start:4026 stop:5651 length:1626 start_codon:yes stop_codon:yes gene_type:complete